jgi:hypothetical protein
MPTQLSEADTQPCGERACPALGCEAAPKPDGRLCQAHRSVWRKDRCAAQRGASPLTTKSSCAQVMFLPEICKYRCSSAMPTQLSEADTQPCGEQACPALGCEAAPKPDGRLCQAHRSDWRKGRCAARRGASPLTTKSSCAQVMFLPEICKYRCSSAMLTQLSEADTQPCGERACPALGCEAAPLVLMPPA